MTTTDAGPWGKQGPASPYEEEMVSAPHDPEDEPFTEEEEAIIRTAMSILPHLGPDATTAYLDRASDHRGNEHEA